MSTLLASIIIPTYNRPGQLQAVLQALASQSVLRQSLEVLVIDDGSHESYQSVISQAWPFQLRYIRQENQGEVAARNRGANLAQSQLIIFLDDDIYVEPQYIAEMAAEHERHPDAILMGVLYPWLGRTPTLFQRYSAETPKDIRPGEGSYIECGTGTMAVAKAVYESLGGMQTLGPGGRNAWGGMDFAYRAHQAGHSIRRCTRAVAYHDDFAARDLKAMSQRYYTVSRLAVLHLQRYPELLPQIPMFRDKTPIDWKHDPPRLIVRKILRAAGSSRIALDWLESIVRFLEKHYPSGKLLAPLYGWIVRGHMALGYKQGLREFGEIRP